MRILERVAGLSRPRWGMAALLLAAGFLTFAVCVRSPAAAQDQPVPSGPPDQSAQPPPPPGPGAGAPPYTPESPEQLDQLVAPIALYPDPLVAQVLTASTFPEQVVEADRWLQGNPGLTGPALAQAADQQPWDPSVKALTAFPAVLGNMDRNLSWTSSLGDAYYNQPQDVMNAVQVMRQRAQAAGNLQSNPQQMVTSQAGAIDIEPANPNIVYVPAYDPWVVYGAPVLAWTDWYPYPGIWFGGPYLSFGVGFPIGFFAGFAWGWHNWGFRWHDHALLFHRAPYFSRSTTFFNRAGVFGARGPRGVPGPGVRPGPVGRAPPGAFGGGRGVFNYQGAAPRPFNGDAQAARGFGEPRGQTGMGSGAFSNYNRGGEEQGFAARGAQSFGGGFRGGGGGGFHGGGGGGRGR